MLMINGMMMLVMTGRRWMDVSQLFLKIGILLVPEFILCVCVLDSKIIIGSSKEVGCMSGLHPLRVRACQIPVRCCSSDDFFVDRFF